MFGIVVLSSRASHVIQIGLPKLALKILVSFNRSLMEEISDWGTLPRSNNEQIYTKASSHLTLMLSITHFTVKNRELCTPTHNHCGHNYNIILLIIKEPLSRSNHLLISSYNSIGHWCWKGIYQSLPFHTLPYTFGVGFHKSWPPGWEMIPQNNLIHSTVFNNIYTLFSCQYSPRGQWGSFAINKEFQMNHLLSHFCDSGIGWASDVQIWYLTKSSQAQWRKNQAEPRPSFCAILQKQIKVCAT